VFFARHGLPTPRAGAVADSMPGLLSIVAGSDFVGLLPLQIPVHPVAARRIDVTSFREGPLQARLAVIMRADAMPFPAVRHFVAQLSGGAHHDSGVG